MKGYIGAKVDNLAPKTKIQSYYDYDYDEFHAALKKRAITSFYKPYRDGLRSRKVTFFSSSSILKVRTKDFSM